MFWVDYHRGMMYCDVFADSSVLGYMQVPGIDIWDQNNDYSKGRQLAKAYKTVGINRGELKFVDIVDELFGTRKTSGFKIMTWLLKMSLSEFNLPSLHPSLHFSIDVAHLDHDTLYNRIAVSVL